MAAITHVYTIARVAEMLGQGVDWLHDISIALAMVFKLITATSKIWRSLSGNNRLPQVIQGVRVRDGIQVTKIAKSAAA